MKFLLDTCAILWAVSAPSELSKKVRALLVNENSRILVSPISCAEIACAVERNKVELDRHWKLWFRHFVSLNGWELIPIDLPVIEEAYSLPLPFHQDPADRILVSTARLHQAILITADKKILNYPHVESIF